MLLKVFPCILLGFEFVPDKVVGRLKVLVVKVKSVPDKLNVASLFSLLFNVLVLIVKELPAPDTLLFKVEPVI